MDEEIRMARLEFQVEAHTRELDLLKTTGETLKATLVGVQQTLMQIKYLAMGACGAVVANQFGLMTVVKSILGH